MNSQGTTPFDELRLLVQQLRDECAAAGSEPSPADLFAGVDDWISVAEQRREHCRSLEN